MCMNILSFLWFRHKTRISLSFESLPFPQMKQYLLKLYSFTSSWWLLSFLGFFDCLSLTCVDLLCVYTLLQDLWHRGFCAKKLLWSSIKSDRRVLTTSFLSASAVLNARKPSTVRLNRRSSVVVWHIKHIWKSVPAENDLLEQGLFTRTGSIWRPGRKRLDHRACQKAEHENNYRTYFHVIYQSHRIVHPVTRK